jgi:hypothetical protein
MAENPLTRFTEPTDFREENSYAPDAMLGGASRDIKGVAGHDSGDSVAAHVATEFLRTRVKRD